MADAPLAVPVLVDTKRARITHLTAQLEEVRRRHETLSALLRRLAPLLDRAYHLLDLRYDTPRDLTASEQRLLDAYRACQKSDKATIGRLAQRFAGSPRRRHRASRKAGA